MVMSNKGLSVTASRKLLDHLILRGIEKVFVLHDFDISGFSIFGTLATSARRYTFANKVPLIDLGLRLSDVDSKSFPAVAADYSSLLNPWDRPTLSMLYASAASSNSSPK